MRDRSAAAVQGVFFVAVFAASGALAGVVWERLWDAPSGFVYKGQWFLDPPGPDYVFSGTGWYVVVALVTGAVIGFALCWLLPRHELTSLLAVVVGSMLAGWVMFRVGHALGPPDPRLLAAGKADFSKLPSDLLLVGADDHPRLFLFDSSALVAFPMGAIASTIFVLLVTSGRRSRRGVSES